MYKVWHLKMKSNNIDKDIINSEKIVLYKSFKETFVYRFR